jgi:hypothetical protein
MILFEGRVSKVEADTTGWGETLRVVGVAVTVKVTVKDDMGDYEKETVLHLPKYVAQPMVGDLIMVSADHVGAGPGYMEKTETPEHVKDEIAELVAEEPDEVEDGHVDTEFEERTEPTEGYDINEMEADRG